MEPSELCNLAKEAMTHAYAPYSGYKVGAALLCADGTVYQGCNMETLPTPPRSAPNAPPSSRRSTTATGILPPSPSAAARTESSPAPSLPAASAAR